MNSDAHGADVLSLRALYEGALAQAEDQRAAWLSANCSDPELRARAQRLLDARGKSLGPLAQGAQERLLALQDDAATEQAASAMVGRRYGAFRLLKSIGQGGMATVYLAERCEGEFVQRAAVKLLRRTVMSSLEQRAFARERKLLASLEHPHIARLIDGGVSAEDEPYLVMEFVEGLSITEHARTHGLSLGARIGLLIEICQAVAAAHAQLIVHRDLKPSNVMVGTDGRTKLLDFGVAKLLGDDADLTQQGYSGFTPAYAAPEQFVGGPITTATDVYALGVLGLELLIGYRPSLPLTTAPSESALLAPPSAALTTTVTNAAARPTATTSTTPLRSKDVARFLRGDLDNILRKCLSEEPARRYQSAAALAEDLQRFQRHEPVSAHPPSRWYRAQKFVARHRGGVLLTTLFALATVASLCLALWQAQRARTEATHAITAEKQAIVVKDFLLDMLRNAQAKMPRDEKPTPEAMAMAAARQLESQNDLAPQARIELLVLLAEVASSNQALPNAYTLLDRADSLAGTLAEESNASRLQRAVVRAKAWMEEDKRAEARVLLLAVLPLARAERSSIGVDALVALSEVESIDSRVEQAVAYAEQAQEMARALYPPRSRQLLTLQLNLGSTLMASQQAARAIGYLDPALAAWKREAYGDDADMVAAMEQLANARGMLGDSAGSTRMTIEVLAVKRRIYSPPHEELLKAIANVATDASREGRYDDARAGYAEALAMNDQLFGMHHPNGFHTRVSTAMVARGERDFESAERGLRQVLDDCRRQPAHSVCPRARFILGLVLAESARPALALSVLQQALQEVVALHGENHPQVGNVYSYIALAELGLAHAPQALLALDRSQSVFEAMKMQQSVDMMYTQELRARALHALARDPEALVIMQAQVNYFRQHHASLKNRFLTKLMLRARLLQASGQHDAAVVLAREAQALQIPRKYLAPADATDLDQLLATALPAAQVIQPPKR